LIFAFFVASAILLFHIDFPVGFLVVDYIISTCKNIFKKVEIMDMDPTNTSDHVPVIAQIKRKLVRRVYKPKTTIVKKKWKKCDLNWLYLIFAFFVASAILLFHIDFPVGFLVVDLR
jgi:hypothetical protein